MYKLTTHAAIDEIPPTNGTRWPAMTCPSAARVPRRHGAPWLRRRALRLDAAPPAAARRGSTWPRRPVTSSSTPTASSCSTGPGPTPISAPARYYPKLVIASPYTPATGAHPHRRLAARAELAAALIQGSVQLAERLGVSGLHWLFTDDDETEMAQAGLMPRLGCQFHWRNDGYTRLRRSARRPFPPKSARRSSASAAAWPRPASHSPRARRRGDGRASGRIFHRLYEDTFDKRGGMPTLTLPFFREIGRTMGEQLLLVLRRARPRRHRTSSPPPSA
jgi:hypothetical protein